MANQSYFVLKFGLLMQAFGLRQLKRHSHFLEDFIRYMEMSRQTHNLRWEFGLPTVLGAPALWIHFVHNLHMVVHHTLPSSSLKTCAITF